MPSVLELIAEITRNREHALLDVSVISALHQISGASQARVLDVVQASGETYVQERAWIQDGKAVTVEDLDVEFDDKREPLSRYPVLMDCLRQKQVDAEEVTAAGDHILWQPIWSTDKINGCIQLVSNKPFPADMRSVIRGVLTVYSNYQNLIDYSERDSLTGLYNRKTFDEKFARMACTVASHERLHLDEKSERRHTEDAKSHWLAVVDIDHFKLVNDTFGHLYGDEVLLLVANILRGSFRSQDRVFRFGGEEFVVLLRSATLESARKILDRFRQNVEQYDFPQVGKVTVSLGFVSITNETPVVILGRADQALYYAKEHGRNQIRFYDELVEAGQLQTGVANDDVEFF
jgi:diguanylate cyclase (GGDEF)-like protein